MSDRVILLGSNDAQPDIRIVACHAFQLHRAFLREVSFNLLIDGSAVQLYDLEVRCITARAVADGGELESSRLVSP